MHHRQPYRQPRAQQAISVFRPTVLATAALLALGAQAQTGGVAQHGSFTVSGSGNVRTIRTVNGAGTAYSAIDWQTFSVAAGSTTRIEQPGVDSLSLNRVVSNTPSQLLGNLWSNGKVVLVNAAGIAVGAGAVVDTAGFVASTLAMADADLRAGRLRLGSATGEGGLLRVEGLVRARTGDVVLLAPAVELAAGSVVVSDSGAVVLAAGRQAVLTGAGLEGIQLLVQAPADRALNLGTLRGNAVGVFASQLRHSGLVQAQGVNAEGGRVWLRADNAQVDGVVQATRLQAGQTVGGDIAVQATQLAHSGVLDASGQSGGSISLQALASLVVGNGAVLRADGWGAAGGRIRAQALDTQAGQVQAAGEMSADGQQGGQVLVLAPSIRLQGVSLHADGQASVAGDGGTVQVGGGFQGLDPLLPKASAVVVDAASRLSASAGGRGQGGTVVVWSDVSTAFAGAVQALGGAQGGDGGLLEVSGKGALVFTGTANASAAPGAGGQGGTLLLDPRNITVDVPTAGGDPVVGLGGGAAGDAVTITPAALAGVLNSGTRVRLLANNDITVNQTVLAAGLNGQDSGGLSLQAGRNVRINADVQTRNGDILLSANDSGADPAYREAGAGSIVMRSGTSLNAGLGDVTLSLPVARKAVTTPVGPDDGQIVLGKVLGQNIEVSSAVGDVLAQGTLNARGVLNVETAAGRIGVAGVTAQRLNLTTESGAMQVNGLVQAADRMVLASASGGVTLAQGGALVALGSGQNAATGAVDPVVKINAAAFDNLNPAGGAAAPALQTPAGFALVRTQTPVGHTRGNIVAAYKHYGDTCAAGNCSGWVGQPGEAGFVYRVTPVLQVKANAQTSVYGQAVVPLDYSVSGLVDGDLAADVLAGSLVLPQSLSGSGQQRAGSYGIGQGTLADTGLGYRLQYTGASYTVSQAVLGTDAGVRALDRVYDGTRAVALDGVRLLGVQAGDQVVATGGGVLADKQAGQARAVTAQLSAAGADGANYTVAQPQGLVANIAPRPLDVLSATGVDKVYDATRAAQVSLTDNRVAGDVLGVTAPQAQFASRDAATGVPIALGSLAVTGVDAGNYTLRTVPTAVVAASITPRPLFVAADNQKMAQGTAVPALTYRVAATTANSGLAGNETVADALTGALALEKEDRLEAGQYDILRGTLAATANYRLASFTPGLLTVLAAQAQTTSALLSLQTTFATASQADDDEGQVAAVKTVVSRLADSKPVSGSSKKRKTDSAPLLDDAAICR